MECQQAMKNAECRKEYKKSIKKSLQGEEKQSLEEVWKALCPILH